MKYLLLSTIFMAHGLAADDDGAEESREGFYATKGLALVLDSGIGFAVPFKNDNEERANLERGKGHSAALGYSWGDASAEFGFSWDDPEVADIYYTRFNGRTTGLDEVNDRFSIDGRIKNLSYVGRLRYGRELGWNFTPYGELGAGVTNTILDYAIELAGEGGFRGGSDASGYSSDWTGVREAGFGLLYPFDEDAQVDIGYRLSWIGRGVFGADRGLILEPFTKRVFEVSVNVFLFD